MPFKAVYNFMTLVFLYQVSFKEVSEADMAVEMLNGRMFGRKVIDGQQIFVTSIYSF